MDEQKDKLLLRRPENYDGHEVFEVVITRSPIHIALRDRRGCYIGFDEDGELVKPCSLSSLDLEAWLSLSLFDFSR